MIKLNLDLDELKLIINALLYDYINTKENDRKSALRCLISDLKEVLGDYNVS